MLKSFDSTNIVAPFVGAWIEILRQYGLVYQLLSLRSSERGLKFTSGPSRKIENGSLRSSERGLKYQGVSVNTSTG